jgi:hypothetical protein
VAGKLLTLQKRKTMQAPAYVALHLARLSACGLPAQAGKVQRCGFALFAFQLYVLPL